METVMSCRIGKEDLAFLNFYGGLRKKSRAAALREVLEKGRKMEALDAYKNGEASLGKAAEMAGVCTSEMIDLLGEYGVKARVSVEDFHESVINLEKLALRTAKHYSKPGK